MSPIDQLICQSNWSFDGPAICHPVRFRWALDVTGDKGSMRSIEPVVELALDLACLGAILGLVIEMFAVGYSRLGYTS